MTRTPHILATNEDFPAHEFNNNALVVVKLVLTGVFVSSYHDLWVSGANGHVDF